MELIISPSVLSCDFANIQRDVEMINDSEADWFHVDVMDGVFVPNISFGFPVVEAIKKHAKKPLDVHLMIQHPANYISQFRDVGADILTVHYEACTHLHRTIQAIHDAGMKAGVALNPHTPVDLLQEVIEEYREGTLDMTQKARKCYLSEMEKHIGRVSWIHNDELQGHILLRGMSKQNARDFVKNRKLI